MTKIIKNLILSALLLFSASPLMATHVQGGNIAYTCTGAPNQFVITLTLYRDCTGIDLGATEDIIVDNSCGLPNQALQVTRISLTEVSQICPDQLGQTSCNGGNLAGTEKHVYTGIITLPDTCDSWTFSYNRPARNGSTNLVGQQAFHVTSTLYSGTQACNNSPTINAQGIPYVCASQVTTYDYGIVEPDGDSLTFEFVNPLGNLNMGVPNAIPFVAPFTVAEPIPGISLDFNTGVITFNYGFSGFFVAAVLISEYNQCNELVGSLIHDIQFVIETCQNQVPTVDINPTAITNFNNFGTGAQLVNDNQIKLCTDDRFCFDVSFSDVDPNTSITLSSSVADFLPGATFTQNIGTNPASATVCWDYVQGYTGSSISINASDNACPVPGFATYVIDLDVPPAVFPGEDGSFQLCREEGAVVNLFDLLGGFYQSDGRWENPGQDTIPNLILNEDLITGVYLYIVEPDLEAAVECGVPLNPCAESDTAFIDITMGNLNVVYVEDSVIFELCESTNDGRAYFGPITGDLGPFDIIWTAPDGTTHFTETIISGESTSQQDLFNDGPNDWTITVTDQNGCTWSESFYIGEGSLQYSIVAGSPTCFGLSNGSINLQSDELTVDFYITNSVGDTINEIPGTNPPQYADVVNLLPAGTYTVSATDDNNCTANNQILLPETFPGQVDIEVLVSQPDCHQTPTGVITVTDVLNTSTSITDMFYTWAPVPQGNLVEAVPGKTSLVNLLPGTYSVTFVDTSGCSNEKIIVIEDRVPLAADVEVISKPFCRTQGTSQQTGNGIVIATTTPDSPGTGTARYLWRHLESGELSENATFPFRDPGNIEITLRDALDCVYKDTIYVDSINPQADFILTSTDFYEDGFYEGEEELKISIENLSTGIIQTTNPNATETYEINFNATDVGQPGNWFLSTNVENDYDTSYFGINQNLPTTYQVCLVAQNYNDCSDTICKDVVVHRIPDLILPNVFTPGAEPNNEFFFPATGYTSFSAQVFNRYGVVVFEFNEVTDKWDGTHYKTGEPLSDGVYSYVYRGESSNGRNTEGNGQVHLLRHKP